MKDYLKKFGFVLLIFGGLVLVLNFGFFWQNLKYTLSKPQVMEDQNPKQGAVKLEPNILIIESLGIKVPVRYVDQASEPVFQKALLDGVVHYPGTAMPGELGNSYIFGHSSDNAWSKGNYKSVFAVLPRIEKGAEIVITDKNGNQFIYRVTDSFVAGAKDVQWLSQNGYKKKQLTLQTSYPIGTSLKRWIVVGEIVETPVAQPPTKGS